MPEERNNDNRLGLWSPKDSRRSGYYRGYGMFNGRKVYSATLIANENPTGKQPQYELYWRTEDCAEGTAICTPIYKNEGDKVGGQTSTHWVNVFRNKVEQGSNKPEVSITFKEKQAKPPQAPTQDQPADEDIPF